MKDLRITELTNEWKAERVLGVVTVVYRVSKADAPDRETLEAILRETLKEEDDA